MQHRLSPEVSECQRCRRCRGGVEKCRGGVEAVSIDTGVNGVEACRPCRLSVSQMYVPGRPSKARQGPSKGTPPRIRTTGPRSIRGRRSMTTTGGSGRAFLERPDSLYAEAHTHAHACACGTAKQRSKSRPLLFVFGYSIWGSGEDSRQIVLSERRAEWFPLTPRRRFILLSILSMKIGRLKVDKLVGFHTLHD